MTPDQLASRLGEVQVVDVRYPNEWDAGHIDGALHIAQDELDDHVDELSRARPVVTVCRSGNRSATAAEMLAGEGFTVENLEGGVLAWVDAGHPLRASGGGEGIVVEPEPTPDDRPESHQRLQDEFLSVLMAVQEHFGDSEPSDEEVRAFLRDRLISQGKSPEEADAFMAQIESDGPLA